MSDQLVADKNILDDKLIIVGVISSAHGIKGHVIVKSFTDPAGNIVNLPVFDQDNTTVELKIIRAKPDGTLICSLNNCHSRTEAERFIKKFLYCLRSNLPPILTEDEFYIEDLKGLKVVDLNGNHIANITNIANYGGGDIVEVQFLLNGKLEMLPFTKELFPEITKNHAVMALKTKITKSLC